MKTEYYIRWQRSSFIYLSQPSYSLHKAPRYTQHNGMLQYSTVHCTRCNVAQYSTGYSMVKHISHNSTYGLPKQNTDRRRWNNVGSKYMQLLCNEIPSGISTWSYNVCSWTHRNTILTSRSGFRWHVSYQHNQQTYKIIRSMNTNIDNNILKCLFADIKCMNSPNQNTSQPKHYVD